MDVMSIEVPPPDDGPEVTPELALVGAGAENAPGDPAPSAAPRRRPPLPTLHLAAHEIVRFRAPESDPEPA